MMKRSGRVLLILTALLMLASPIHAADIAVDEACSLADAIKAANTDSATGGCPAGEGADTITLSADIALDAALPPIESDLTIDGADFEINGNEMYRIFHLAGGDIAIRRLGMRAGHTEDNGGAIFVDGASSLTISRSSIVDSEARFGGGIFVDGSAAVSISDSTITGNSAYAGGGIEAFRGGDIVLTHVSLVNNAGDFATAMVLPARGRTRIHNSLIAGNGDADCPRRPDELIASHIGDGSCYSPLFGDPMLAPRAGKLAHFSPLDGSPVINAAAAEYCTDRDQLGRERPQGAACDVGAIESASAIGPAPTPAPDTCTLADQIIAANTDAAAGLCPAGDGADTITLTENLTLSAPLPPITSDITIDGAGHTISGDKRFRIFILDGGKLSLNQLSLVDGFSRSTGGAVLVYRGDLTLSDCKVERHVSDGAISTARESALAISDCSFLDNQGTAIFNRGTASITNTSFRHNVAELGGAINSSGDLTISASRIVENAASLNGSAISAVGNTRVIDTRIIGNVVSSPWSGAAIWHRRGDLTIVDSAISDNKADNDEAVIDATGGELVIENTIISGNSPDAGWEGAPPRD